MKKFIVDGKLGKFEITLPEEFSEISKEYLERCTEHIHPAENYALVGVVSKEYLNTILTASKKGQSINIAITPIFIKAGPTDAEIVKRLSIGTRVIVSGSDLSIGNHINSPYNKITTNNIVSLCEGDRNITKESILLTRPVCFLEFKIVPISAIKGNLDDTPNRFDNEFVKIVPNDSAAEISLNNSAN